LTYLSSSPETDRFCRRESGRERAVGANQRYAAQRRVGSRGRKGNAPTMGELGKELDQVRTEKGNIQTNWGWVLSKKDGLPVVQSAIGNER